MSLAAWEVVEGLHPGPSGWAGQDSGVGVEGWERAGYILNEWGMNECVHIMYNSVHRV